MWLLSSSSLSSRNTIRLFGCCVWVMGLCIVCGMSVPAITISPMDRSVSGRGRNASGNNQFQDDYLQRPALGGVGGGFGLSDQRKVDDGSGQQTGWKNQYNFKPGAEAGGFDKEREPGRSLNMAPLVELKETHEVEPEVEGWLEKLEREGEVVLPDPIVDDNGNVVLSNAVAPDVEEVVSLPLTEQEVSRGLRGKVSESTRWLSEWARRLVKMLGNQVKYRQPT